MGETTNAAVEKLSPLKKLTPEQEKLVEDILAFAGQHITGAFPAVYTIYGDAGTGKSVVLSQLFARLQRAARHNHASPFYGTTNYFLVNHPEILKVTGKSREPGPNYLKRILPGQLPSSTSSISGDRQLTWR